MISSTSILASLLLGILVLFALVFICTAYVVELVVFGLSMPSSDMLALVMSEYPASASLPNILVLSVVPRDIRYVPAVFATVPLSALNRAMTCMMFAALLGVMVTVGAPAT